MCSKKARVMFFQSLDLDKVFYQATRAIKINSMIFFFSFFICFNRTRLRITKHEQCVYDARNNRYIFFSISIVSFCVKRMRDRKPIEFFLLKLYTIFQNIRYIVTKAYNDDDRDCNVCYYDYRNRGLTPTDVSKRPYVMMICTFTNTT